MTTETPYGQAHLFRVIEEVLGVIPQDFPPREEIIRALKHMERDLTYRAPEQIPGEWHRLCEILNYHCRDLEEPLPEWVQKSVRIVRAGE